MNIKKQFYLIMSIISFIILCIYIYISVDLLFYGGKNIDMNINSIFGNILVCTFFLSGYIILTKDESNKKLTFVLKKILLFLLILSVIFFSIYNNLLFENGFKSGKKLYWQITTLILGISSIIFNFYIINYKLKNE